MPLLDLQKRGRELGRIRIGTTVERQKRDGSGTFKAPQRLETFRFTTPSERSARLVAELFGGEARLWADHPGQWEVVTGVTELPVMMPPGHPLTQNYELWSGGGLQRRCDGEVQENGQQCVCPREIGARMAAAAKGNACKPMTRLAVMLPDLLDLGVWLLVSGGYNAAIELRDTAELLQKAANAEVFLPAILRLEQRSKTEDGETRHWGVPVLEVGTTLRALASGEYASQPLNLPPVPGAKALEAGHTQPPPPRVDEPLQRDDVAPSGDVIDGEVVEEVDAQSIANNVPACETKADVQVLVDRAKAHRINAEKELVADPASPGMMLRLADLIRKRWREVPPFKDSDEP